MSGFFWQAIVSIKIWVFCPPFLLGIWKQSLLKCMLMDQCDGTLRYGVPRLATPFLRRINGGLLGRNPTSTTSQLFNKLLNLSVLLWEYKCINTHKGLERCLAIVRLKEVLTVLNIIKTTLVAMLCVCIEFYSYKVLPPLFWWICSGAEVEWDWEISIFFFFFFDCEKGEIEVIIWLTEIVPGRKGGICDLELEEARFIKELLRWLLRWNWEPTATQGHAQSVNRNEWKLK